MSDEPKALAPAEAITREGADDYEQADRCPFCGFDEFLSWGSFEAEGPEVWQEVDCAKCEKSWSVVFYFSALKYDYDSPEPGSVDYQQAETSRAALGARGHSLLDALGALVRVCVLAGLTPATQREVAHAAAVLAYFRRLGIEPAPLDDGRLPARRCATCGAHGWSQTPAREIVPCAECEGVGFVDLRAVVTP